MPFIDTKELHDYTTPLRVMKIEPDSSLFLTKENFLTLTESETAERDEIFQERFQAEKDALVAIITKHHEIISSATSEEEKLAAVRAGFNDIFTSLISSLQLMIGDSLISPAALPENAANAASPTWEENLRDQFLEKYELCITLSKDDEEDYKNITDFFKAIYEATFYSSFKPSMKRDSEPSETKYGSKELALNFEKIKAAADLKNCVGGAISALEKLAQDIKNPTSMLPIIEELLLKNLSFYCLNGNQIHLSSLIRHIVSGEPSKDESMISAASDMTMEDLFQLQILLTTRSGELILEHTKEAILNFAVNIEIKAYEESCKHLLGTSKLDQLVNTIRNIATEEENHLYPTAATFKEFLFSGESAARKYLFKNDLETQLTFFRIVEEMKAESNIALIKETATQIFSDILFNAENETEAAERFADYVTEEMKNLDETLADRIEDDRTDPIIEMILQANCFTMKDLSIPIWLKEKMLESLAEEPDDDETPEQKITRYFRTKAQEFSQIFKIPLHLITNNNTLNFAQYQPDQDAFAEIQSLLNAGTSLDLLQKNSKVKHLVSSHKKNPIEPRTISAVGLILNPELQEIFNFLSTDLSFIQIEDENLIETALALGDCNILQICSNSFLDSSFNDPQQHSILRRWYPDQQTCNTPLITLANFDLLYQSLLEKIDKHELLDILSSMLNRHYRNYQEGDQLFSYTMLDYFLLIENKVNEFFTWLSYNDLEKSFLTIFNREYFETLAPILADPQNKKALEQLDLMYQKTRKKIHSIMGTLYKNINEEMLENNDSRFFYYLNKYGETSGEPHALIAKIYLTGLHGVIPNKDEALKFFHTALPYEKSNNNFPEANDIRFYLAQLYYEKQDFEQAKKYISESFQESKQRIAEIKAHPKYQEEIQALKNDCEKCTELMTTILKEESQNLTNSGDDDRAESAQAAEAPSETPSNPESNSHQSSRQQ